METQEKTSASPNTHHGHAVKRLRRDKQMSQKQLGDLIGMTQQAIYRYEKEKVLDEDIRERIAKGLGVSVDLINELEEDRPLAFYIENNKITNTNYPNSSNITSASIGTMENPSIGTMENPNDNALKMALDKLEHAYNLDRKQYEVSLNAYKEMVEFLKKEIQELKEKNAGGK